MTSSASKTSTSVRAGHQSPALADICKSLLQWRVALYFAWSHLRSGYRRSTLGPLWITMGTAIGIVGMGFLWSNLLKTDRATYIPSLTIGLIAWQLITGCITDSAMVFRNNSNIIKNFQVPFFLLPMQIVFRHLINLAHNLLVYIGVVLILNVQLNSSTLWIVPGFALLIVNLLWITLFFSILGARFHDLSYALIAVMPIVFFLSPVLYHPDYLSEKYRIILLNPIAHLLEIIRSPLLGTAPDMTSVIASVLFALIGWAITLYLFHTRRNRIAFWL